MGFPVSDRVIYEKNTLEEVKCELRFPPILAIESSLPAAFQDQIRSQFPYYELKTSFKLPSGVPSAVSQVLQRDLSIVGNKSYSFSTEDRIWTLALSRDGLSLTCRNYQRWEQFRGKLANAIESLSSIYNPSFYTHTCLRYKNSIRRAQLELLSTPWSRLLQPWVSGPLGQDDRVDFVDAYQSKCLLQLPEEQLRVEATFGLGVHPPSKEQAFVIEAHIANDVRKDLVDVIPRLNAINRQAGCFFRWCITDELHRAMRPSTI